MKRAILGFLAAVCLAGIASAEPRRGGEGPENYYTYRSTSIPSTAGMISGAGLIHKVIVSSPAATTTPISGSTITVYNAMGSDTNTLFTLSASTIDLTGYNEFTFDIWASSGIRASLATTGQAGSASIIYKPNSAYDRTKIWTSSFSIVDTATHTIATGNVLLNKVIVLQKASAGTSTLNIWDSRASAPTAGRVGVVDLGAVKEYEYNVMLSSGLTISGGPGTGVAPRIIVLYKVNPSKDWENWKGSYQTGTVTNHTIASGTYVLGGVVNGDDDATGQLTIYDSRNSATRKIADIDAATTFGKKMFDVDISSGITVTNVGNGKFTILYRKK